MRARAGTVASALSRRRALSAGLGGLVVLASKSAAGATSSPRLEAGELRSLEAWYEALIPGADGARVAAFVDEQLRADPRFALLQLRYLNWPVPWVDFYRDGVSALDGVSRRRHRIGFAGLSVADASQMALDAAAGRLTEWPDTPPLEQWYAATRADVVDIVHGTPSAMSHEGMTMVQYPSPKW